MGRQVAVGQMPGVGMLPGYGLVVPRTSLDEILFRRAEAAGAETVEGFEANTLSVDAGGVTVTGRSRTRTRNFSSRLVIIAEGARQRLASSLGLVSGNNRNDLFALRAYYEGVAGDPGTAGIFFGAGYFPGYAWLFPIGQGRANVVMGMVMDVSKHYGINARHGSPWAAKLYADARARGKRHPQSRPHSRPRLAAGHLGLLAHQHPYDPAKHRAEQCLTA